MDNIGTGFFFPPQVDSAARASIKSYAAGPYDLQTNFDPAGSQIYLYIGTYVAQSFTIPNGIWTAAMIASSFFSGLKGAKALDDGGYLKIITEEDNPMDAYIRIDAPANISATAMTDATQGLKISKGIAKGFGKGNMMTSRNPDPDLVTPEETKQELAQALQVLLIANPGEMPMARSYGGGFLDMPFEPQNERLLPMAKYRVIKSTAAYDRRIVVRKITHQRGKGTSIFIVAFDSRDQQVSGQASIPGQKRPRSL